MTERVATLRSLDAVYGGAAPSPDDPAEVFHEASKAYPSLLAVRMPGVRALQASRELRLAAQRSVRVNPQLEWLGLPPPTPLERPLGELLAERRSCREFSDSALSAADLAALLHAAYGVTRTDATGQSYRTVPSGGALYPLELYAAVARVDGLGPGVYSVDPRGPRVARTADERALRRLVAASVYPEIVEAAAVTVHVVAVLWRTRFKYGLRGYRFALLEAGHVMQNVVLAAEALGLAAVPLGGYYDRLVDETLRLDGVDESTVYTAAIGARE